MFGPALIHYGKAHQDFYLTYGVSPRGYLVDKKTRRVVMEVRNGKVMMRGKIVPLWKVMGYHSPHEYHAADQRFLLLQILKGLKSANIHQR